MSQFIMYVRAVVGRSTRGATMVEYALLVALIALVVVVALGPLGDSIGGLFDQAGDEVDGVTTG
jgi:pilus assembly protein Flp/PilA